MRAFFVHLVKLSSSFIDCIGRYRDSATPNGLKHIIILEYSHILFLIERSV